MFLDHPMCTGTCRHRRPDGSLCGAPLDAKGTHARSCPVGGWLVRRHNSVVAVLADWCENACSCTVFQERVLPTAHPDHSEARMDLIAHSPHVAGAVFIDFTVVSALSVEALQKGAGLREGVASSLAADDKVRKYPNCRTHAFPVEDHGRFGEAAIELIRMLAPTDLDRRSKAISELYHDLACTLQRASADAVIAACT